MAEFEIRMCGMCAFVMMSDSNMQIRRCDKFYFDNNTKLPLARIARSCAGMLRSLVKYDFTFTWIN